MRFRRLFLRAFGPFTEETIDFRSPGDSGLHVIFGPNEAGKSTSLRAVRGLLFGIPNSTRDAHLHAASKLCVGAEIFDENRLVQLFRYKKRAGSLVDENGRAVPEELLGSMLGGLDENTFTRRIGLDQYELDLGAEALLGGSEEGLFAAGTGGAEVRSLLEEFKVRGEILYKKQGKNPLLNRAVARYQEAKKIYLDSVRPPDTYERQRKDFEQASSGLESVVALRRKLREEQREGNRLLSVLGDLAAFQEEEAGLLNLGEVVLLPEGARQEREELERELRDVEVLSHELFREKARVESLLSKLPHPSALETSEVDLGPLVERLGSERKAMLDVPKLRALLAAAGADLQRSARRLGFTLEIGDVFEAVYELLPPESAVVGLRSDHAELSRRKEGRRALALQTKELIAELGSGETPTSASPYSLPFLQAALADGLFARGAIERARELHQNAKVQTERVEAALALLPGLRLSELGAAPSREQLDSSLSQLSHYKAEIASVRKKLSERERWGEEYRKELEVLVGDSKLLRDSDLALARRTRDKALDKFRATPESSESYSEFTFALESADRVVDELRANAKTLNRVLDLESKLVGNDGLLREERAFLESLLLERTTLISQVANSFTALGLPPPLEPEEWRRTEGRLASLSATLLLQREAESGFAVLKEELSVLEERLRELVRSFLPEAETLRLSGLIEALGREVEARASEERARDLAQERRTIDEKRLVQLKARLAEAEQQVAAAEVRLGDRLVALGLPGQLRGEELEAVLRGFAEMQQKLIEGRELKRRVDGIDRDTNALLVHLRDLAEKFQVELPAQDLLAMGEAFSAAVRRARAEGEERKRLTHELVAREAQAEELEARRARAKHRLSLLAAAAGVESPAALPRAEERSLESHRRAARLVELRGKILAEAGGETFASLAGRAKLVTQAELSRRLDALGDELERKEEEVRRLEGDVSSLGLALDRYRTVDVADARQKVATRAAEARTLVEEFIRNELARQLLSEQMEAFARSFAGPLAERSSEIFSTLTLGKYARLEFGLGDRTLRCCRAGEVVEVDELSRGTRAQLYFALRVASLESYFSKNRAIPLVFDDLFVDFDDDRATAAFEILGQLAERTQVLYFTHLSRDVEVASSAVPRLGIHRIGVS